MFLETLVNLQNIEKEVYEESVNEIKNNIDLQEKYKAIQMILESIKDNIMLPLKTNDDVAVLKNLLVQIYNSGVSSIKLAFSGYYLNSFTLQRSLFESCLLFDYFTSNPPQIEIWNKCDRKTRWDLFKPEKIREYLDTRDSYKEKKRAEAYNRLSQFAGHPTPESFRLLKKEPNNPHDNNFIWGAFFNSYHLKISIGELSYHLAQMIHYLKQFEKLIKEN